MIGISKDERVLKILVHLDNEETLALVKNALTDDLYYSIAHGYIMQIMNISATKWNGIKAVLDIYRCSANETIYFGDDQDDIAVAFLYVKLHSFFACQMINFGD